MSKSGWEIDSLKLLPINTGNVQIYIDTEFKEGAKRNRFLGIEFGKPIDTIDLISIGLVSSNGEKYYALNKDCDVDALWNDKKAFKGKGFKDLIARLHRDCPPWFKQQFDITKTSTHIMFDHFGKTKQQIVWDIIAFVDKVVDTTGEGTDVEKRKRAEFWGWYADYDWVVFCWLFGRMVDLPKGFPYYCRDLKQLYDQVEGCLKNSWGQVELCAGDVCAVFNGLKDCPNYPAQREEDKHHALHDAEWNKQLHDFLKQIIKDYVKS